MGNNEVTCSRCFNECNQELICYKMQKAGLRHAATKLKRTGSDEAKILLVAVSNSLQEYPCTPCKVLRARVDWAYDKVVEAGGCFYSRGANELVNMIAEEIEALIN